MKELQFTVTKECNMHCVTCYGEGDGNFDPSKELSEEMQIKILKQNISEGIEKIHIMGAGEALTRPKLCLELMSLSKKHGIYGSLHTNGTLLTKDIVKSMIYLGWDEITISLDGPDQKTNDIIRGNGTYNRIAKNIGIINECKISFESSIPYISVSMVLMSTNYTHLKQMLDFCKEHSVGTLTVNHLLLENQDCKKFKLTSLQEHWLINNAKAIIDHAQELGIDTNIKTRIAELNKTNYTPQNNGCEIAIVSETGRIFKKMPKKQILTKNEH